LNISVTRNFKLKESVILGEIGFRELTYDITGSRIKYF
jgi:hypothetical protein